MNKQDKFVIGIMSGSSLDGVDLCYVQFSIDDNNVDSFNILKTSTYPFTDIWRRRLGQLHQQSAIIYAKTHVYFGHYLAEMVNQFIEENHIKNSILLHHMGTQFFMIQQNHTVQIGDGASLSALTGFPVICDFRSVDVALGRRCAISTCCRAIFISIF